MKRQRVTFFGLGVVVGVVITMICIAIMRKPDNKINLVEETTHTQDIKSSKDSSTSKGTETLDIKKEESSLNNDVTDVEYPILIKDENGEFTKEALELAKEYLIKYNNSEWDGYSIVDSNSGIKIGISWGTIKLEDEETPICTEERSICDKAIESYMSGEWDGKEMITSNGHTIKLDEGGGYLLLDGYISVGQRNLDIPEDAYELFMDVIPDYEYVPGQGTYVIIDKKLVKFLRGEQITLPGEELSWIGFQDKRDLCAKIDIDSRIMYDLPTLIYNEIDGKLYLTSGDETCTLNNSENYVYVFEDYNVSKITYLGRVNFEHQYPGNIDMETLITKSK